MVKTIYSDSALEDFVQKLVSNKTWRFFSDYTNFIMVAEEVNALLSVIFTWNARML